MGWKSPTIVISLALVLVGCSPSPFRGPDIPGGDRSVAQKKRITAVIKVADVESFRGVGGSSDNLAYIVHAGLAQELNGVLYPAHGESIPSVDNGLWKLLPANRMETTWKIRPDARWQDGVPVTAEDVVFTARVSQDPQVAALASDPGWPYVEKFTAIDSSTLTVTWKQIYILADGMVASPKQLLPRHLLEGPYEALEDKALFMDLPYWAGDYIGAGPFKLRELVRGSHMLLDAFDGYVLGRPKIDELEIRFIPDENTLVANFLAGAADMTIANPNLSPDSMAQLASSWPDGKARAYDNPAGTGVFGMLPQQLNPSLPALKDPRFRKALLHALDRETMNQTIMAGMSAVAHTYIFPALPDYDQLLSVAVRYEYDPRKTADLLEQLGYRRGSSGFWEDAAGQRVMFEHHGPTAGVMHRSMLAANDYWKTAGLDVQYVVPRSGLPRSATADYPGIRTASVAGDYAGLWRYFHSSFAPVPDNNYFGSNAARYMIPEWDALLERWYTTVPQRERTQALQNVTRYQTENAIWMGYMYNLEMGLYKNKVRNVTPATYANKSFNAHLWDVI